MSTINIDLRTPLDRLKYLVDTKARGIAADFAREIGVAPATFHYYLKGRAPSFDVLEGMCNAYSININWFITGDGEIHKCESSSSEELTMNLEVLQQIIEWVEERLESEGKELAPDKKAQFIALAYEYFVTPEEGDEVDDKGMKKLFRLVV